MVRFHSTQDGRVQFSQSEEDAADAAELEWTNGQAVRDALAEINRLEAEVTQRRLRDSVLTADGKTWLTNKEAEIATERAKL
tara:strand:- start:164 stop:409 length:246 start_codon:yes stop_codon:yes gene_type:complete